MKIPDELLKKWNDLKSHGDGKKIADSNDGISVADVSRAFTTGECSDETFDAIGGFFKEKEKKVREYLNNAE